MSEALKSFLNKNTMGHLYDDIIAKLDTIALNETMMNDFCNTLNLVESLNVKHL